MTPERIENREIRVFVSSTFTDMRAERDELVKRVFPELRKLCEERGVTWGEVDLRWGITDEQKAEGKVLPICLDEIRHCRPYFIGLLGERYGWVPDEIPGELIKTEGWLSEHCERSVTELEILHGVLNNPEMATHSYFYLRDPTFVVNVEPKRRAEFVEEVTQAEISKFGLEAAEQRATTRRGKLSALKNRIRSSGLPFRENYRNPQELGKLVLADITAVIERLYPQGSQPHPLDRDAAEHEAFAQSRAKVYIGRPEYFDRLDAHADRVEPPLVVLGESGSGKSALLANWAIRRREKHRDEILLMHFIGATPFSSDWAAMLRRIMGEFKRHLGLEGEIPDAPDVLRATFANWLQMAATRGKVILILDALNQLDDRDGAPDLFWLPPVIPASVRLILSTLPGRPLTDLGKRRWPTLTVEPLREDERAQFILKYLAQYRKTLNNQLATRIAAAPHTANPLYLRALLEELRLFGSHEQLEQRITSYLNAADSYELYEKILERWESDYEDDTDLVGDAMSLLWAARRGLSEAELLDLLGKGGESLPRAQWSPLYLAARDSLVIRSGLLGFFHDYLRQAVRDAYIPTIQHQRKAHLRLAAYFDQQPLTTRAIDELPWQLAQSDAWERLYSLLGDLSYFDAAWDTNQFEVKGHWAKVEANSPFRMVRAFQLPLSKPGEFGERYLWKLGRLLADTGHPAEALDLQSFLVQRYRQTGDVHKLSAALGNQAGILSSRGDLERAMALHKEQERICLQLGDLHGLLGSLGDQALILKAAGDLDGAMELHKEEERICRTLGNRKDLSVSLNNQSNVLYSQGDLDGAMTLYKQYERLCRELGDKEGLAKSLGNQANVFYSRGNMKEAMTLHKEDERICRELGNKDGLIVSLNNQAVILTDRGDLDGAMALLKQQEHICTELGNRRALQSSLTNQAMILYNQEDFDGATALLKESERICRDLGNREGLAISLGNQATVLYSRGDLVRAMALYKEQERICRELNKADGIAISLVNQARTLSVRLGRNEEALPLAEEAYGIATTRGMNALAGQINSVLDKIRSRLSK